MFEQSGNNWLKKAVYSLCIPTIRWCCFNHIWCWHRCQIQFISYLLLHFDRFSFGPCVFWFKRIWMWVERNIHIYLSTWTAAVFIKASKIMWIINNVSVPFCLNEKLMELSILGTLISRPKKLNGRTASFPISHWPICLVRTHQAWIEKTSRHPTIASV